MAFVYYNANPENNQTEDCVIRALSVFFDDSWEHIYADLTMQGLNLHAMPSSNNVWSYYLKQNGYQRHIIPDLCPNCYTISDFANDHPTGTYVVGTGEHVVAVVDGNYYDTWDSGKEVAIYYWSKGD